MTREGPALAARTRALLEQVRALAEELGVSAQLNLIAADGRELVAARYAIGQDAPSLHWARRADGSVVIASEAMEEGSAWTSFEPGTLLRARLGGEPEVTRIPGG